MTEFPLPKSKSHVPIHFEIGRICVKFSWNIDRWHHCFQIDQKNYLQSVEKDGITQNNRSQTVPHGISDTWPASPVITEVTPTEAMGHPALVAIGLAGRSHFSASLTASQAEEDSILVEVACRAQEAPKWLGSTYLQYGESPQDNLIAIQPQAIDTFDRPVTILWSYRISVGGIEAVHPASCGKLLFPSNC
jgi:hypothetical protein